MVCSIDESALRRVAEAIDRLDASRKSADSADLEAQVAAVWALVREIDPELARLASRYSNPALDADRVDLPPARWGVSPHEPQMGR
jgi:hypothetical protein